MTALVIQDYFGGKIAHDISNRHYWNIFEDGTYYDLVRKQFPKNTQFKIDEYTERKELFLPHAQTEERYKLLKDKIATFLQNNSSPSTHTK